MKAATVSKLNGEAYVERAGERIALEEGSNLSQADIIVTGADSKIELRFMDDSLIELGPSTQVNIRDFAFDPSGQDEPSFALHMMGGVVRSISGKIVEQNPESFKLTSPLGAVGIRGTETLHVIGQANESHAVINLGYGHTVVITSANGQSVVLTQALTGVGISPSGIQQAPVTPEIINQFLQQVMQQGDANADGASGASAGRGYYVVADSAVLSGMDVPTITENVAFVAAEDIPGLLAELEEALELTDDVVEEALTVLTQDTGSLFTAESSAPSYTAPETPATPSDPSGPTDPSGPSGPSGPPDPAPTTTATEGADEITLPSASPVTFEGLGGNDAITIDGTQNGFIIYGDRTTVDGIMQGGSDTIFVTGDMTSGSIYGDAGTIANSAQGGNDSIIINGNVTNGSIYGDAKTISGDAVSGNDVITIEGTLSGSTFIYGDAQFSDGSSKAGSDSISIATMDGGTIYGDAQHIEGGGNGRTASDTITVGTMNGGTIYGDARSATTGIFSESSNEFNINQMNGGTIYTSGIAQNATHGSEVNISSFNGGTIHMSGSSSLTMDSIATSNAKNIHFGNGTDTITFGELGSGATGTIVINASDAANGDVLKFASGYINYEWATSADGSTLTFTSSSGGSLQILFDTAVTGTFTASGGGGWEGSLTTVTP